MSENIIIHERNEKLYFYKLNFFIRFHAFRSRIKCDISFSSCSIIREVQLDVKEEEEEEEKEMINFSTRNP